MYAQYRRALKTVPLSANYTDFGWYRLPSRMDMSLMAYGTMLREFSTEIANEINALINYTHDLAAWDEVMKPLNEQRRFDVLVEFVRPIASLALGMPYAIRARFLFAAVHLCHQVNQLKHGKKWVDQLPPDRGIKPAHLDQLGVGWQSYAGFKQAMEGIFDKGYRQATRDYRHRYNHQIPPGLVLGITGMVTRKLEPKTGLVSYVFGATPPLPMNTIVQLMSDQCRLCCKTFEEFKKLIEEHQAIITTASP
ncbi:hypothetical protein NKH19_10735 [Mesorhizobium sp. M1338]|uniref:hypothetical protein n=1 Tax=unclassified Mesorhizobium TaxID=325217 RepID=UPI003338C183